MEKLRSEYQRHVLAADLKFVQAMDRDTLNFLYIGSDFSRVSLGTRVLVEVDSRCQADASQASRVANCIGMQRISLNVTWDSLLWNYSMIESRMTPFGMCWQLEAEYKAITISAERSRAAEWF
jgi:hypothetical protein